MKSCHTCQCCSDHYSKRTLDTGTNYLSSFSKPFLQGFWHEWLVRQALDYPICNKTLILKNSICRTVSACSIATLNLRTHTRTINFQPMRMFLCNSGKCFDNNYSKTFWTIHIFIKKEITKMSPVNCICKFRVINRKFLDISRRVFCKVLSLVTVFYVLCSAVLHIFALFHVCGVNRWASAKTLYNADNVIFCGYSVVLANLSTKVEQKC